MNIWKTPFIGLVLVTFCACSMEFNNPQKASFQSASLLSESVSDNDVDGAPEQLLIQNQDIEDGAISLDKISGASSLLEADTLVLRNSTGGFEASRITKLLNPVELEDATNKIYVDSQITVAKTEVLQQAANHASLMSAMAEADAKSYADSKFQDKSTNLQQLSGLTQQANYFLASDGTGFVFKAPSEIRSTLGFGLLAEKDVVDTADVLDGAITNAKISETASISDTKLSQISTPGKIANSATSATSADSPDSIVLRNTNGDFWANSATLNYATITNAPNAETDAVNKAYVDASQWSEKERNFKFLGIVNTTSEETCIDCDFGFNIPADADQIAVIFSYNTGLGSASHDWTESDIGIELSLDKNSFVNCSSNTCALYNVNFLGTKPIQKNIGSSGCYLDIELKPDGNLRYTDSSGGLYTSSYCTFAVWWR